jgi:hypothetical protein
MITGGRRRPCCCDSQEIVANRWLVVWLGLCWGHDALDCSLGPCVRQSGFGLRLGRG